MFAQRLYHIIRSVDPMSCIGGDVAIQRASRLRHFLACVCFAIMTSKPIPRCGTKQTNVGFDGQVESSSGKVTLGVTHVGFGQRDSMILRQESVTNAVTIAKETVKNPNDEMHLPTSLQRLESCRGNSMGLLH